METKSIGSNLIYQRKLKGYSQEELSEKTQVTIRTIQRIEKGDVNHSPIRSDPTFVQHFDSPFSLDT